jgi:trehalose synthase
VLESVGVGVQRLDSYVPSCGAATIDEIRELAAPLIGARILHINATPYGGGVAELLRSKVPLLQDLGVDATWKLITGDDAFFSTTKAIHNGLQGAPTGLTEAQWKSYCDITKETAAQLDGTYDVIVVHDPQPLAIADLAHAHSRQWVWRCHVDTSDPNPDVWASLRRLLDPYDAAVFTL